MPDTTNKMAAAGFAQGAKKYQQRARTALPILVRQAKARHRRLRLTASPLSGRYGGRRSWASGQRMSFPPTNFGNTAG